MIKLKTILQVGVGASEAVNIDDSVDIRVSYGVSVSGSCTFTIQHSLDGLTYFNNSDTLNQTTDQDGNYIFPVRDVRVNVTAGAGTATLVVRQLVV